MLTEGALSVIRSSDAVSQIFVDERIPLRRSDCGRTSGGAISNPLACLLNNPNDPVISVDTWVRSRSRRGLGSMCVDSLAH